MAMLAQNPRAAGSADGAFGERTAGIGIGNRDISALSCTLSPKTGEAEHTMKMFIQQHMTAFLQPVGEHISELQRAVMHLSTQLAHVEGIAEKHGTRAQDHEAKLNNQRNALESLGLALEHVKNEVTASADKHATLKCDLDLTRGKLNKLEQRAEGTHAVTQDLLRSSEHADSQIRDLQQGLAETNVHHIGLHDRLSELKHFHKGLNDRHLDFATALQQQKHADEQTKQALRHLKSTVEKQNKETQWSFMQLDNRSKSLESTLESLQDRLEKQASSVTEVFRDLNSLRGGISHLGGLQQKSLQQLQEGLKEQFGGAGGGPGGDIIFRLAAVEEGVSRLIDQATSENKGYNTKILQVEEAVNKVAVDVTKLQSDIRTFDKNQNHLMDSVRREEQRVSNSEARVNALVERLDRCEKDINENVDGLTLQRKRSDDHDGDILRLGTHFQETMRHYNIQQKSVQNLRDDLSQLQGNVGGMGSRIELAHEYVQGLSKGMQDTHRRVQNGEDGLLPPKGNREAFTITSAWNSPNGWNSAIRGGASGGGTLPRLSATAGQPSKASTLGAVSPDIAAGRGA
jgi:chromosome segregation ATPase